MIELLAVLVAMWLPACPSEDAVGCYWDGGANGAGRAFISIDEDLVVYLPAQVSAARGNVSTV